MRSHLGNLGQSGQKKLRLEKLESRRMLAWTVYQHTDNGSGAAGTLSRAILDANAAAENLPGSLQEIKFEFNDIAHSNPQITLTGPLPAINAPRIHIDG